MKTRTYRLTCVTLVIGALSGCALEAAREPVKKDQAAKTTVNPTTLFQCTRIDDSVSVHIQWGLDSCIEQLTAFDNTTCDGKGEIIPGEKIDTTKILFIGRLAENVVCSTTLSVRAASPCYLHEYTSNGTQYRICYHDGRRINLNNCIKHTGVCGPPHNP